MRTILAALDDTAAAQPVLDTAVALGSVADATVHAVHVLENGTGELARALTEPRNIQLRALDDPVPGALLSALEHPDVVAGVLGARGTPGGARPAGHVALDILERTTKPIVIVPPDVTAVPAGPRYRLLVPLEGTEQTSQPITDQLTDLIRADVELIALHVFTAATVPAALDHPEWDLPMWADEFLARHCPDANHIDLRSGPVGGLVTATSDEEATDLIVLSWRQDASPGHAAVVRHVLSHATVPVLLLPTTRPSAEPGVRARAASQGIDVTAEHVQQP